MQGNENEILKFKVRAMENFIARNLEQPDPGKGTQIKPTKMAEKTKTTPAPKTTESKTTTFTVNKQKFEILVPFIMWKGQRIPAAEAIKDQDLKKILASGTSSIIKKL